LDFNNCPIAKCIWVKEHINYIDIDNKIFKFSFPDVKNVASLKKKIYKRYNQSLPSLNKDKILKLGVSITHLEIIGFNNKIFNTIQTKKRTE